MELEDMHPEKRRRMMRYARERKNFRLTSYSTYKLKLMSDYYRTTETAIVEAAIHLLSHTFTQDQIETLGKGAPTNESIEAGCRNQTIANNLDI